MILQRSFFSLGLLALVTLPLTADWDQPSPSPTATGLAEQPTLDPASCKAPPSDAVTFVQTPGTPFTAIPSADGCWVFVGLTSTSEIATFRRDAGELKLQSTVPLHDAPTDMVLTHDGQLLLAATGDSVTAVDVTALIRGSDHPSVYTIRGSQFDGTIHVNVTHDDGYLFVANERGGTISVVNLKQARASGFRSSGIVGNIPAAEAPIAVTLSPDDKLMYSTSELASGLLAAGGAGCEAEGPRGIEVIDVARAETDPAHSVLSLVPGGCEPVRLVLSDDGAIAYVTARGEDEVLAFDTGRLKTDPTSALLGQVPAGAAPVGLAIGAGRLIVASSNRFGAPGAPQHLTILDSDWQTWGHGSVLTAEVRAGSFPREERLSPDGKTLYVTNFTSNQLQMVDLTRLPPLGPQTASESARPTLK
jgi:DNA-binding beta-propeller fold protein YncE